MMGNYFILFVFRSTLYTKRFVHIISYETLHLFHYTNVMLFNFFYLIIFFTSISLVIVCMHVQVLRSVHLLKNNNNKRYKFYFFHEPNKKQMLCVQNCGSFIEGHWSFHYFFLLRRKSETNFKTAFHLIKVKLRSIIKLFIRLLLIVWKLYRMSCQFLSNSAILLVTHTYINNTFTKVHNKTELKQSPKRTLHKNHTNNSKPKT